MVDDGSSDGTADVARAWGAQVVALTPNQGLAAARNAGVSAARGQIVVFTDDDCDADPAWLARMSEAFGDPSVDAAGGRVLPGPGEGFALRYVSCRNPLVPLSSELLESGDPVYRLRLYLRAILQGPAALRAGDRLYSVVGANMAFRRPLIYDLQGFDEAFRFGGEEEDLCRRADAHGARIVYAPAARVVHRFEPGLKDTLRRSRAYGRGNARAARKHAEVRPIVYPFPVLAVGTLAAGLVRRRLRLAVLGLLAPLVTYPRWLIDLRQQGSVETIAYPYVQLAQEVSTMLGEIDGHQAGYERTSPRHLFPDEANLVESEPAA